MQILGRFCSLLIVGAVLNFYKRFLEYFLGFFLMDCVSCLKFLSLNSDFGCWLLVFGCFGPLFNTLGLCLLFGLGLKMLHYACHCKGLSQFLCDFRGKSSYLRNRFSSKSGFDGTCNSKISSFNPPIIDKLEEPKDIVDVNGDVKGKIVSDEEYDDDQESYDEDEVFDVMALRKLIKIERRRANAAYMELEKERMAAATAAEEAMAMILRLQNEKSVVEMEANQFRRLTEEKQLYDQEVIQSLRWIVMKSDEGDQFEGAQDSLSFCSANSEDALDDGLIGSLDMDLSP